MFEERLIALESQASLDIIGFRILEESVNLTEVLAQPPIAVCNVEFFTVGDVVVRCLESHAEASKACDVAAGSPAATRTAKVGGEDRSGEGFMAVRVAQDLDAKVEALLAAAAG